MAGKRPTWRDITSYSQGDKARIPTTFELRLTPHFRICVVRGHRYAPDVWVVHCHPWFDTHSLNLPSTPENRDEAQARAIALVRDKIAEISSKLREVN